MGGCLVLLLGVGVGIAFGWLSGSIIVGVIVSIISCGFLAAAWNEAGAVINMATQDKRDKAVIDELRKMNGEK